MPFRDWRNPDFYNPVISQERATRSKLTQKSCPSLVNQSIKSFYYQIVLGVFQRSIDVNRLGDILDRNRCEITLGKQI